MKRSRRAMTIVAAIAAMGATAAAQASLSPGTLFPGIRAQPRLPAAVANFERHYGQLRYVGTTSDMVVADWGSRELLINPETRQPLGTASVTFTAHVYTSSSSSTRAVECEAINVDSEGWAASWTGRQATAASGWQDLSIGTLPVSVWGFGTVMECTMNRYSKIGTFFTYAQAT